MITLSVVVAAFNEEASIGACIRALKQQKYCGQMEIIVVDDGSSDQTATVAEAEGCRVIRGRHVGQVYAKKKGCESARGEILAVLDADCIPGTDWAERVCGGLNFVAGVSAVTGPYQLVGEMSRWGSLYWRFIHLQMLTLFRLFPGLNFSFIMGGNVAFRRDHYHEVGGYFPSPSFAETEMGLAYRLRRHGRIVIDPHLSVRSSARRFSTGILKFVIDYKIHNYFVLFLFHRVSMWFRR